MKTHKAEYLATAAVLAFFAVLLIPVYLAFAASGYDYSATLTLTNTSGADYNGRWLVDTFPKALKDGGFIYQDDGEDIYYSAGNACAMALSDAGTQSWAYWPGTIPAGSNVGTVYTGSHTATRDQQWIAAGSDACTVSDHADLDVEQEFLLEATVLLFKAPTTGVYKIIDKVPDTGTPTGYQLIITGTPQAQFNIYGSGTEASVAIDLAVGVQTEIQAWYNGVDAVITDGTNTDTMAMSGSVSQNSESLEVCELAGLCDDVAIKE